MKKAAILTTLLLVMSASAAAFESAQGGYIVNDTKAMATVNSQKTFAMLSEGNDPVVNMVSFFTPEDVKNATEQELSAAKFEELYQQMALLQRSQLKLDRKPADMVDFNKYAKAKLPGSLVIYNNEEKFADIKPDLHIEKIGKNNAISYTYYLKKDTQVSAISNTFLTANNRLYLLTTMNKVAEAAVEKPEEETPEAGKKLKELAEAPNIFKKDAEDKITDEEKKPELNPKEFTPVAANEVSAALKKQIWQKQVSFVKGIKFTAPSDKQETFGFKDSYYGKQVNLPEDWVYTQIKIDKNEATGLLTIASPLNTVRYITNEAMKDSFNLYQDNSKNLDKSLDTAMDPNLKKDSENYTKAHGYLEQLEQLLVTGSFKVNDPELGKMLSNPMAVKMEAYGFLNAGLEKLKKNPLPQFKLNDYQLDVQAKDEKALIDLSADVTALEDINLDGNAKFAARKDAWMILLYAKKKDQKLDDILEKSLKDWQF